MESSLLNPFFEGDNFLAEADRNAVGIGLNPYIVSTMSDTVCDISQFQVDVESPHGDVGPTGNIIVHEGEPCTGKSTVAGAYLHVVRDTIDAAAQENPAAAEAIRQHDNVSREALVKELSEYPNHSMLSPDGGPMLQQLFGPSANIGVKISSAEEMNNVRVGAGRARIKRHTRNWVSLLVQRHYSGPILTRIGSGALMHGLADRCEWRLDPSGVLTATLEANITEIPGMKKVHQRLIEVVENTIERYLGGIVCRPVLKLDPSAKAFYFEIVRQSRVMASSAGSQHLQAYALRHPWRSLRRAASRHYFLYGSDSCITFEMLENAVRRDLFNMRSFEAMTYVAPKLTRQEEDAADLEHWLLFNSRQWGTNLRISQLTRVVANAGLTVARFKSALPTLCRQNKAMVDGDCLFLHTINMRFKWPKS